MKIHVPNMLPICVETINKQTQQTNKQAATLGYKNNNNNQPQWLRKITISHHGLECTCTCIMVTQLWDI